MAVIPTAWSSSDRHPSLLLSNSDLTAAVSLSSGYFNARSLVGRDIGKFYWEVVVDSVPSGSSVVGVGVMTSTGSLGGSPWLYVGYDAAGVAYYSNTGTVYQGGVVVGSGSASTAVAGTVLGLSLDCSARVLRLYRNNVLAWTVYSIPSGVLFPTISLHGPAQATANFGASAFAYTPPSGFEAGFGKAAHALSGNIKDSSGTNAARKVRAYREDTGDFMGETTSSGTTGDYSIATLYSGAHTLVFYPASGENLPALVLRGVIPV